MNIAIALMVFTDVLLVYTAGRIMAYKRYRSQYAGRLASVPFSELCISDEQDPSPTGGEVHGSIGVSFQPARVEPASYGSYVRYAEVRGAPRFGGRQRPRVFSRSTGLVRRVASRTAVEPHGNHVALEAGQMTASDRFREAWVANAAM